MSAPNPTTTTVEGVLRMISVGPSHVGAIVSATALDRLQAVEYSI